ncbi:uncharacterized protein C8Q71DRAFT_439431 [Rhodofomes roseus]|uniref:Uncharacterized protein n=1 Tax=Rhodofomes roseus TaxID=34475 RepID=A0ABQ8KR86_9APHY|nr:uncharacterized protein C8Q71DRAFT_439431 [Rhodofomes roseus]KAH9841111.1 hypothetical protein C8Q71DRAFT_439431 [Rhodofomes roseus]
MWPGGGAAHCACLSLFAKTDACCARLWDDDDSFGPDLRSGGAPPQTAGGEAALIRPLLIASRSGCLSSACGQETETLVRLWTPRRRSDGHYALSVHLNLTRDDGRTAVSSSARSMSTRLTPRHVADGPLDTMLTEDVRLRHDSSDESVSTLTIRLSVGRHTDSVVKCAYSVRLSQFNPKSTLDTKLSTVIRRHEDAEKCRVLGQRDRLRVREGHMY